MAFDASEGDIVQVIEISGQAVTRDEAAQLLKISNYDVATAVNKLFEAEGGIAELLKQSNDGWDGSAFGADRYGQHDGNTNLPSFNIESFDYADSGGPSAAPTRPPSRISQRSGLSTHMSDAPVQSVENGQESGVVGNTGPAGFRPATQDHYPYASWAMVPATKSTEYIPDAPLLDQIRPANEPGFLKPLVNRDYLPALLTILHSVPLFRNALLSPEVSASNYWRGEDWWKGTASATSITVDNSAGAGASPELELLYETQRLMAFLDSSERAYASIHSLLQLDAWREPRFSPEEPAYVDDDLLKFLLRWGWAYQKHVPAAQLNGTLRSTIDAGGERQESFVLDAAVAHENGSVECTLYDALDDALFVSDCRSAHIMDISDVLILRLTASKEGSKLNCRIPPVFYADRYLEKNRATVDEVFAEKKQYSGQIATLEAQMEKLKYHTPQKVQYSQKMETLKLLKTSMKAFDSDTEAMTESLRDAAALAQLQSLYRNIERKLCDLEEEKKKVQETLDKVSEAFRYPIDQLGQALDTANDATQTEFAHTYKLCGVATSTTDHYICHPDQTSSGTPAKQWWHLNYVYSQTDDSAQINRRPISLDDVITEVSTNCEKALIVYANEAANSAIPIPLSAKLETFIKKDNANFQQELAQAEATWGSSANDGNGVTGEWVNGAPGDDSWNLMSADEFFGQGDSGVSSATLTPNTETEEDAVPIEMQEVNGGIAAWVDMASNASSETVGAEPMDIVLESQERQAGTSDDVQMVDAETRQRTGDGPSERIEVVEKKGG